MSKVYIPHLYLKYDPITKQNVASIDLNEAVAFGELMPVTSGEIVINEAVDALYDVLAENFKEDDYILAIGDPLMIGAALAYAYDKIGGPINVLRWDRHRREYDVVEFGL